MTSLLAGEPRNPGEIMRGAGCWQGGSTVKFSIVWAQLGLPLHVFDSFEGVEQLHDADHGSKWNFGGQY